jgi:hypothetical protein
MKLFLQIYRQTFLLIPSITRQLSAVHSRLRVEVRDTKEHHRPLMHETIRAHQLSRMGWTIGVLGFDSQRELGIFLFTTASRPALGPTQPPIQWVPGALFLGVKRPGREADHSPPYSAEIKERVELYLNSPIRLHGVVLS